MFLGVRGFGRRQFGRGVEGKEDGVVDLGWLTCYEISSFEIVSEVGYNIVDEVEKNSGLHQRLSLFCQSGTGKYRKNTQDIELALHDFSLLRAQPGEVD